MGSRPPAYTGCGWVREEEEAGGGGIGMDAGSLVLRLHRQFGDDDEKFAEAVCWAIARSADKSFPQLFLISLITSREAICSHF